MRLLIDLGKKLLSFFITTKDVWIHYEQGGPDFVFEYDSVMGVAKGVDRGMIRFAPEDWSPGVWAGTDGMTIQLTQLNTPNLTPDITTATINFVDLEHRTIYLHDHRTLLGWWSIRPYRGST